MKIKTTIYGEIKSHNKPSFYAPPVAWAAGDFVRSLIEDSGGIVPHAAGMIVVSDECSLGTVRELASTAARGSISPLRFAGASPSIVAGLPALQQGIRGPTVTLTMSPKYAMDPIVSMVNYWITRNKIESVIVVSHYQHGIQSHLFKGMVIRSIETGLRQQVVELCNSQPGDTV